MSPVLRGNTPVLCLRTVQLSLLPGAGPARGPGVRDAPAGLGARRMSRPLDWSLLRIAVPVTVPSADSHLLLDDAQTLFKLPGLHDLDEHARHGGHGRGALPVILARVKLEKDLLQALEDGHQSQGQEFHGALTRAGGLAP